MSLLNFDPSKLERSGSKGPFKLVLGIGALVGVIALGSTLAASINLNSGDPVEFGQGVAQTVACSGNDSILVTPTSRFINADGAGDFYYTSVTLSSIPSSCNGVDFTITAYDEGGDSIVLTYCSDPGKGDKPVVKFDGGNSATTDASYREMYSVVSEATSSSFTLTWVGGPCGSAALAKDVYRITIESKVPVEEVAPATYEIGDTGPGGGKIFFVKSAGAFSYQFQDNQSEIEVYQYMCETEQMFCDEIPEPHYTTIALTSEEQAVLPFDYLEVSSDNSTIIDWGSDGSVIGGTSSKIGSGITNTANIAATFTSDTISNNAAKYVDQLVLNGFDDWFLPSSDELHLILRLDIASQSGGPSIGSFPGNHWASTQDSNTTAHLRQYSGTESLFASISRTYGAGRVLAVRGF